jgi:hypothetical protein
MSQFDAQNRVIKDATTTHARRQEARRLRREAEAQLELLAAEGDVLQGRLREGLRQVKAADGAGGVSTVVEVAPWSRIPEARALLVPRDD